MEREKMEEFVGKLWSNPALEKATLLKKENQILGFLKENSAVLQQAFAQPNFFPGKSYDEAVRLFLTVLTDKIQLNLLPIIEQVVESTVQSSILQAFQKEKFVSLDKTKFKEFILAHTRTKTLRDPYVLVLESISHSFYEKYIPIILKRRKVIYNELVRRDRLTLDPTLIPTYLSLCSLFRPLFWHKFPRGSGSNKQMINLAAGMRDPKVYESILKDLEALIHDEIGWVPDKVLHVGLESCLNFTERPEISTGARLITIMTNRAAEYEPNQKVDKGAETPDKSWFNINRRTAKYYGYDVHFLEELYQIAGEEGW